MDFEKPSLIKFQIGPVQDFIAQARSTRDLWSGSYLLSFLMASGIRALPRRGGELVFPDRTDQLLLEDPETWRGLSGKSATKLLTPNLPNLFVAEICENPLNHIADQVVSAINETWNKIATACFETLVREGVLEEKQRSEFKSQTGAFPSITWQSTIIETSYCDAYEANGKQLDAVRQTRDFKSNPISRAGEKDSLSTKEIALVGGTKFQEKMAKKGGDFGKLFKHADHLSAIALIKRVWHLAYLAHKDGAGLHQQVDSFRIRSTRAIAAKDLKTNEDENTDTAKGEKYLAAIAFDGDSIGRWISGELLDTSAPSDLRKHHTTFSGCLSDFALGKVRGLIEETEPESTVPTGFLIYAGGDDVVALTTAEAALGVAERLRNAFLKSTAGIKGTDPDTKCPIIPDASAGIAIAHFKSPLQDLIRAAQAAEKHAKNEIGRPAFSISLMKRSGSISHWGAKWDSRAISLHSDILQAVKNGELSAKFPHRVCQLLEPYVTQRTGISKQSDASDFSASEIILLEFEHAAIRQGSIGIAQKLLPELDAYLAILATNREEASQRHPERTLKHSLHQEQLKAIIGLCTTVAFTARNLPTADRHAHA